MNYRTSDIAQACNVTVNTVRNWCKDYASVLSPGASGSEGQRIFTSRDLEVLKYIAQLRKEGMQSPAILQRLGETTFPEIDQKTEIEPSHDDQQTAPVTAVTQPQAAPLATMDTYAINAILARVERLERSYKVGVFYGFGLGFIAACGLFLLILAIAVLYGGFR